MRFRNLFAACLISATLGLGGPALLAQGIITGTITGTVQDSTGAVIPGAMISATSTDKNQTYKATANANGEFHFESLPIGDYSMTISHAGFGDLQLSHLTVQTGKDLGLGAEKLQTGSTVETVEVSTARNLLETTQAQVTTTFDSEMVEDLPTGGGLDQVALLVPGVVGTHGANFSNTNGVGISSNGQRGRSNNFEIDGQANNDNSVGGSQVFFANQDAVAEIQVITNNFSAAYGRNMGSIVNYVTKSGTNSIHGSGFEYYTGNWLSSYRRFQKSTSALSLRCPPGTVLAPGATTGPGGCTLAKLPRFTDNTYGGTLGFPILKDRLFAFGSTQWSRDLNGITSGNSGTGYFPTPDGLKTLQAAFPGNGGVAELVNFGPYAAVGGTVIQTGTPIIETLTGPGGVSVQVPFTKLQRNYNPQSFDQEHLGRLDYQLDPKDRFFLRYLYQNAPNIFAGGSIASGAYYNTGAISHSVGADWTHTFGPRWVNQVRYSFQQSTFNFDGGGFPNCTIKNLSACPSTVSLGNNSGVGNLGLGLASNIPQGRVVKVSQAQDNATWNLGRHSITFGGEFDYQNSPNVFLPFINGGVAATNYNNLLNGVLSSLTLASGASPNIHFTEPDFAGYIQDDWKVSPSLTANLGVRYEFFGQSLNLLNKTTLSAQTGPNPQWDPTLPLNGSNSAPGAAGSAPTVFPFTPTFKKGFEPRIGFAYNPEAMKKLVVRGGFAINFDPAFYNIALNSYSAAPVVNQSTFTGCGTAMINGKLANCVPGAGFVNSAVHAQDDQYNPSGGSPGQKTQTRVTPNFHNPYAESYTLGVQYEVLKSAIVEVRYSGNHTIGNFQSFNGNPTIGPGLTSATPAGGGTPVFGVGAFNTGYATALIPAQSNYFPGLSGPFCTVSSLTKYGSSADLGRQYCGNTLVRVRGNTAFSNYNSLQTSLTTRNLYGFTGSVNWTYGREIDNTSEIFSSNTGNTNAFAQNPQNINTSERGIGATSFKNVTSVGMTYNLPFLKHGNSLLNKTVGGWRLNTLYTFNSGQPYTPSQYYYGTLGAMYATDKSPINYGKTVFSTCDYNFNNGFTALDVCRPFVGNLNAPLGTAAVNIGNGTYIDANGNPVARNAVRYIVNNVNEEVAQGTPYGNSGRNTALGNSYNNVNFGLFKDFHITERYNLQFQTTLFNAFNRAFYGTPDPLLDNAFIGSTEATFQTFENNNSGAFGPSTGSATGSRNIQLGAKIQF